VFADLNLADAVDEMDGLPSSLQRPELLPEVPRRLKAIQYPDVAVTRPRRNAERFPIRR